jgi:hypothetical protein
VKGALDLRDRCARSRCNKLITKGKNVQAEYARYKPFCSYHCQQWAGLEGAKAHLDTLPR